MKKYIYMAVAAIAALSSCSNDDAILNEGGQNETGVTTFTATIEGNDATRATYNATTKKAEWKATTDKISIDGHEYTADNDGATTTFTGSGATEATHHAYFPANIYNAGTPTLPATQTYTADEFNMPMYAESSTTDFVFKNLCAVLAVKVTSADIVTLKSIKVKSDKAMSGAFSVSENKAVLTAASDNSKTVELVSGTTLTLDATGITFYIAIPAQDYAYLNIYLSADGTTYTQAMATKKAAGLGEIARSTMYSIDYEKNAVKLWAGNVFVADRNIGATSETDFGGYYTMGGTYANGDGITWNGNYKTGSGTLTSAEDVATQKWGNNWRMPTLAELTSLKNCMGSGSANWRPDYKESGKNGKLAESSVYSGNSVFLPAAGSCIENSGTGQVYYGGNYGLYWSSAPGSHFGDAKYLFFYDGDHSTDFGYRDQGQSVRAVLAE